RTSSPACQRKTCFLRSSHARFSSSGMQSLWTALHSQVGGSLLTSLQCICAAATASRSPASEARQYVNWLCQNRRSDVSSRVSAAGSFARHARPVSGSSMWSRTRSSSRFESSARSAHGAFMPRPFFPNGRKIKQPISKREGPCRYLGAPLPFIHSGGRPLAKIFLRQSPRHSAADYWSCTIGDGREIRSGADQRASFVCADTTGEASSAPVLRSFSVPLCNWPSP